MKQRLVFILLFILVSGGWAAPVAAAQLPDSATVNGVVGHAQTYRLSCESRSAADLAAFWGVNVSETTFFAGLPRSDNPDVGFVGDVVNVKPGFFRNYLGPRGLATPVSKGNLKQVTHQKKVIEAKKLKEKQSATDIKTRLELITITMLREAGSTDKLFGSVTTADIIQALAENGFDLDKKQVLLEAPIRTVDTHTVAVKLHPEVTATIKVVVNKKAAEKGEEKEEKKKPKKEKASEKAVENEEAVEETSEKEVEKPVKKEKAKKSKKTSE